MTISWKEYRCKECRKLLFKGILVETDIEIKCKQCHAVNTITCSQFNDLLCAIPNCPNRIAVTPKK